MKKIAESKIAQKIIAILIILVMITSYFPAISLISFATGEESHDIQENYIDFNVYWGTKGVTDIVGIGKSSKTLNWNLRFNGDSIAFKDVTITISNNDDTPCATIIFPTDSLNMNVTNKSSYSIIELGNQSSGSEYGSNGTVTFADFEDIYNKEIKATISGKWSKTGTEDEEFLIEKTLTAQITPKDVNIDFVGNIEVGADNGPTGAYEDLVENGEKVGWYIRNLIVKCPVEINVGKLTQNLNLKITINRLTNDESRINNGYTIDWNGLDDILGNPTKTINEDGSVTYDFNKGIDTDEYNIDNTFNINKTYQIVITYFTSNTSTSPTNEANTICNFKAELDTTGWKIERRYGEEDVITKQNESSAITRKWSPSLYSYTPGSHAWTSVKFYTKGDQYITQEQMDNFANNRSLELSFYTDITNISGDKSVETALIKYRRPELTYISDNGDITSKELTGKEFRLKTVSATGVGSGVEREIAGTDDNQVSWYTNFAYTYDMPDDININVFHMQMKDFLNQQYGDLITTYTLNADALGLSETEIKNIKSISVRMDTGDSRWISGWGLATFYNDNLTENIRSNINQYGYGYINFNSTELNNGKNCKLKYYMSSYQNCTIVNKNPILYIELPEGFEYRNFNVNMTQNSNIYILQDKVDFDRVNNAIIIPCKGTYNAERDGNVYIDLTFDIKGISSTYDATYYVKGYMITDNERYVQSVENTKQYKKLDGTIPNTCFPIDTYFKISETNALKVKTNIKRKNGEFISADPTKPAMDDRNPIFESPYTIEANNQVTYQSLIETENIGLKNIKMISRLPIANNSYIRKSSENNSYVPIISDDSIEQISLIDLNNIEVFVEYTKGSYATKEKVDSSKYTIYYSNDATADFDSGVYFQYEEGVTDLSQVKNIKVEFSDEYVLPAKRKLIVQYEMTMPDSTGVAGATSCFQYVKGGDTTGEQIQLESSATYVQQGRAVGNVTVQKQFEGYDVGIAPEGIDIAGIEFKLKYYDNEAQEYGYVKDSTTGEEVIAITDANGIATFVDIPEGTYYLEEITQFKNYFGISNLTDVDVLTGQTQNIVALNKLRRGNLTIQKQWKGIDTSEEQAGTVTFNVKGLDAGNSSYNQNVTTDIETGLVTLVGLPYGRYQITETDAPMGWKIENESLQVTIDAEENLMHINNVTQTGTLRIIKTVPEGQDVTGLTFNIKGTGIAKNANSKYTVKIGEDYSSNDKINVEITENNTKAIITIKDAFLGLFDIQEIDMPTVNVDGTDVEKYVTAKAQTELKEEGATVTVNITNNYKLGTLQIHKTAKLREGDKYTEIGDLSNFQVRVTGTSAYGNDIDKIISLDADGNGSATLQIGKYTVTEITSDGYTTYYGKDATASTEPAQVKINYNQITKQELYNEHTGVGYVRVEKSLEGVTDPQTVISKGIEFKVVGQNIAGGRVDERILINKIDTSKNVAYGVSTAISTGGNYQLEEVEETIPKFYEGAEPKSINISEKSTQNNPLIVQIENKRTVGRLEIRTETDPEGGPLDNIKYKVTEVEINDDGSYKKIGESIQLDGSNEEANKGQASIEQIYSGYYLVEQVQVPVGWKKDLAQIVEVPSDNTGYAIFEITVKQELPANKVIINKELLTLNGATATENDIKLAKLNTEESFEVKITNIDTKEEFYVFTSTTESGVIQGLPEGTYEIEEVYKPKYNFEGFYLVNVNDDAQQKIEPTSENNGKITFTIKEKNGEIADVQITVKNIINTNFGFGGQDSRDNLSKITEIVQEENTVSKAMFYIVDEDDNLLPGAKFRIIDENGNAVKVSTDGSTEFEPKDKKIIVRNIPIGKYTLENTYVPDGYIQPETVEFVVYTNAVRILRVEIQKNIPRGSVTLATTYTNDNDETNYVSRSKYKVVNSKTRELVTFTKTATGDYRKSNLEDSLSVITLKSGPVEIEGLEVGDYEFGIVDVNYGYGIINEEPENVSIIQDTQQHIGVEVEKKGIKQIETGKNLTVFLTESGDLYWIGQLPNYEYSSTPQKIEIVPNLKIEKFAMNDQYSDTIIAIAEGGSIWRVLKDGKLQSGESALAASDYNAKYGTNFVDIEIMSNKVVLIGENGQVVIDDSSISIGDGTPLSEAYKEGVSITKLADYNGYNGGYGMIDSLGRVWTCGYGIGSLEVAGGYSNTPVCISEYTDLKDVKIESLSMSSTIATAIDENGELWVWRTSNSCKYIPNIEETPTKIDSSYFDNNRLVQAKCIGDSSKENIVVVDEFGKVWTWGNNDIGQLGNGTTESSTVPVCVSDISLGHIEVKDIKIGYEDCYINDGTGNKYYTGAHVTCLDSNNRIWEWGSKSYNGNDDYSDVACSPQMVAVSYQSHLGYNVKFKEVHTSSANITYAIDEEGKLWSWGNNVYGKLGYSSNASYYTVPTRVELKGDPKVKKIRTSGYATLIMTEDGRIFACGNTAYGILAEKVEHSYSIPKDITDKFNLPENTKIVEIAASYNKETYVAVDSNGKVYTWGYKGDNTSLGTDNVIDQYTINCISNNENSAIYNAKITKVYACDTAFYALDDKGKLYAWGPTNSLAKSIIPVCETDNHANLKAAFDQGVKIVDIANKILLDSDGKIWWINGTWQIYSNIPVFPLSQEYANDPNYKILEMFDLAGDYNIGRTAGYTCVLLKDNKGQTWFFTSPNQEQKVTGEGTLYMDGGQVTVPGILTMGIRSLSDYFLVDASGTLHCFKYHSNFCGEVGNGTTEPSYMTSIMTERINGWSIITKQF